jgi:hypothetical protein
MSPTRKQNLKVMKWFERAVMCVEGAREAAVKGKAKKANDLRRKANNAMKKAIGSIDVDATAASRSANEDVDPL